MYVCHTYWGVTVFPCAHCKPKHLWYISYTTEHLYLVFLIVFILLVKNALPTCLYLLESNANAECMPCLQASTNELTVLRNIHLQIIDTAFQQE